MIDRTQLRGRDPQPRFQLNQERGREEVTENTQPQGNPVLDGFAECGVHRLENQGLDVQRRRQHGSRPTERPADDPDAMRRVGGAHEIHGGPHIQSFAVPGRDDVAG